MIGIVPSYFLRAADSFTRWLRSPEYCIYQVGRQKALLILFLSLMSRLVCRRDCKTSPTVLANSNKSRAQAEYRLKPTRARVVAFPFQEGRCPPHFRRWLSSGLWPSHYATVLARRKKTWGTTFQEQSTFPVDIFLLLPYSHLHHALSSLGLPSIRFVFPSLSPWNLHSA